jgi:hypothetical protein
MKRRIWIASTLLLLGLAVPRPATAVRCNGICAWDGLCFTCEFTLFSTDTRCHEEIYCIYCLESDCELTKFGEYPTIENLTGENVAFSSVPGCRAARVPTPRTLQVLSVVRHEPRT